MCDLFTTICLKYFLSKKNKTGTLPRDVFNALI
jgi:hypothetical protein